MSVGRTRSESARSKANTSIICRAALTDAHSGARNSKSFLSLFVCVCTETASPSYFIAPFYKVPGVRCPPSRIATCLLQRPPSTIHSTVRTPRPTTTTTRTTWQVSTNPPLPHINVPRAVPFSSTTRSCDTPILVPPLCHSTSRRRDGITTGPTPRPEARPFSNSSVLPPDESASAPAFN